MVTCETLMIGSFPILPPKALSLEGLLKVLTLDLLTRPGIWWPLATELLWEPSEALGPPSFQSSLSAF